MGNFLTALVLAFFALSATAQTRPTPSGLPEGSAVQRDLNYAGDTNRQHTLDLYLPPVDGKPHPILIYVHGGGWEGGDKAIIPGGAQAHLLSAGCAVATINYRLTQEAIYPAQIVDCKAAVRYLRGKAKDFNLNPDRFGAWGDSAGGHLVALLGTSGGVKELEGTIGEFPGVSSRVQCVIDWYGPTDLAVILDQAGRENPFKAHPERSPLFHLFGGLPEDKLDLVRLANPITFVSGDTPPFLIQHGDKDSLVPLAQSQLLADALKKAGVPVEFDVIPGAGHGFGFHDNVLPRRGGFLEKT